MKKNKTIGNKESIAFLIESLPKLNPSYLSVEMFINNTNISSDDCIVYLPSFLGGLNNEINRLNSNPDFLKYQKYFTGKSLEEIIEFINNTRDESSKYFDIENDDIYPFYSFLDWDEVFDHFSCYIIPFSDELYLAFDFMKINEDGKKEIEYIKATVPELANLLKCLYDAFVN